MAENCNCLSCDGHPTRRFTLASDDPIRFWHLMWTTWRVEHSGAAHRRWCSCSATLHLKIQPLILHDSLEAKNGCFHPTPIATLVNQGEHVISKPPAPGRINSLPCVSKTALFDCRLLRQKQRRQFAVWNHWGSVAASCRNLVSVGHLKLYTQSTISLL